LQDIVSLTKKKQTGYREEGVSYQQQHQGSSIKR
jgi:hypothetical protein